MNALFWFLAIILGLYLFMYLAGPTLFRWLLKYLNRKAQEDLDRQTREYEKHVQDQDPYAENIYIDDDTRVKVPKDHGNSKKRKRPSPDEIEEVDYQEID